MEVPLNDLHSISLNRAEKFKLLAEGSTGATWQEDSSEEEDANPNAEEVLDPTEVKVIEKEMKELLSSLRQKLLATQAVPDPAPLNGESLDEFYSRTIDYWLEKQDAEHPDKKRRALASLACADRFHVVSPLLGSLVLIFSPDYRDGSSENRVAE